MHPPLTCREGAEALAAKSKSMIEQQNTDGTQVAVAVLVAVAVAKERLPIMLAPTTQACVSRLKSQVD